MFIRIVCSRWLLGVILALSVVAMAMGIAVWVQPTPRIVIEPPEQNLGELPQEHLELAFTVRNQGSAPLQIDSVKTTCGCTKAFVEQNTIPPGGSTSLKVTMDPQQDDLYGNLFRIISVHSNDPGTPQAEAQFRVAIVKPKE